jgi:Ammonium Transporter Family
LKNFRKIDDAVGATAVHLVGGIWGQLSVGLFADPPTGPKGIFLGGGPNQLIVQAIAAVSIAVWSAVAHLLIFLLVDNIIPIRLSEEDEIKGCDLTEHYSSENSCTELQKPMTTLDKVMHITTPIAQRFTGTIENRNQRGNSNQSFKVNNGYEHGEI